LSAALDKFPKSHIINQILNTGAVMNFWQKIRDNFLKLIIKLDNGFLCDTCRYNHPTDCRQPMRPNAKECGEYKHK
jgi:hypothetical protein